MKQSVQATFEDGVLKPQGKLDLEPGAVVQVIVVPTTPGNGFADLERFRAQHPIHPRGPRLTRDQLHERH